MKRYQKISIFIGVVGILGLSVFVSFNGNIRSFAISSIRNHLLNDYESKKIPVYDLNIPLRNTFISHMKMYEIKEKMNTLEEAEELAKRLEFEGKISENKTNYVIQEGARTLSISKNKGSIEYSNSKVKKIAKEPIKPEQVLGVTEAFIKKWKIPWYYEKSIIQHFPNENYYEVRFINTIEGILNYSNPNIVKITDAGEVYQIKQHICGYRGVGLYPIKTVEQAYKELEKMKVDDLDLQVDIKKIELIYDLIEEESTYIQPVYRFWGQTNKGTIFEKRIPGIKPIEFER